MSSHERKLCAALDPRRQSLCLFRVVRKLCAARVSRRQSRSCAGRRRRRRARCVLHALCAEQSVLNTKCAEQSAQHCLSPCCVCHHLMLAWRCCHPQPSRVGEWGRIVPPLLPPAKHIFTPSFVISIIFFAAAEPHRRVGPHRAAARLWARVRGAAHPLQRVPPGPQGCRARGLG